MMQRCGKVFQHPADRVFVDVSKMVVGILAQGFYVGLKCQMRVTPRLVTIDETGMFWPEKGMRGWVQFLVRVECHQHSSGMIFHMVIFHDIPYGDIPSEVGACRGWTGLDPEQNCALAGRHVGT